MTHLRIFTPGLLLMLLSLSGTAFGQISRWNKLSGGTHSWTDAGNWDTGFVPGLTDLDDIADLNENLSADLTVQLDSNISLDVLLMGDNNNVRFATIIEALNGPRSITFQNTNIAASLLTKAGASADIIQPEIRALKSVNASITGTLTLAGGLTVNGSNSIFNKLGAGTLRVTGPLNLEQNGRLTTSTGVLQVDGELNVLRGRFTQTRTAAATATSNTSTAFRSANTLFVTPTGTDAITVANNALTNGLPNTGRSVLTLGGTSGTSRQYVAGGIDVTGGRLDMGQNGGTSLTYVHADNINNTGGLLRLTNGNNAGTSTTILAGSVLTSGAAPVTVTAGNATITVASTANLYAGMRVFAPGIADGAVIQSIAGNDITLSAAPTLTSSNMTLMFAEGIHGRLGSTEAGSAVVALNGAALAPGTNLIGQRVTGVGIPDGASIVSFDGNEITLDVAATASGTVSIATYAASNPTLDMVLNGGNTQLKALNNTTTGRVAIDPSVGLVLNNDALFHFDDRAPGGNISATRVANNPVITINTAGALDRMQVGDSVRGTGIANFARIVAINPATNQVTLSIAPTGSGTSTNVQIFDNVTFDSLNSAGTQSILRATGNATGTQLAQGTITVGNNSGLGDTFNGTIDLTGSGSNARLIKVGTNQLVLGGTTNNPTAKIEVLNGTVVLAKTSQAGVHAIGAPQTVASTLASVLIGGTGAGANPTVRLAGSYVGASFSIGGEEITNYNDQLHFGANMTVNAGGIFDLNGFSEGFNRLTGAGRVVNNGATDADLILGQNGRLATDTFTFAGTLEDGPDATIGLIKSGIGIMVLSANNAYNGSTQVARGVLRLSGGAGAIRGTSEIRILTGGVLDMVNGNTAASNTNRINNSASLFLSQGTITIRNSSTTATNIDEVVGPVTIGSGSSVIQANHASTVNNRVRLEMEGFNREPGGTVVFAEATAARGLGSGTSPYLALTQFRVANSVPASLLVGNGGVPGTADVSVLLGAFGGDVSNSSNEFMTVQTVTGAGAALDGRYIRPLNNGGTEYENVVSGTVTSRVGKLTANSTLTANTAYNGIRFSGRSTHRLDENVMLKLGGNSDAGFSATTTLGSGMAIFASNSLTRLQGGYLDAGARELILRVNGESMIQSRITGSGGFTKDGQAQLDLFGRNSYTGTTFVSQGVLRAMSSTALGASGAGNGVTVRADQSLQVGNGSTIGNGGGKLLELTANARLVAANGHNVWIGNVLANTSTVIGQNSDAYLSALANGSALTIRGNVFGGGNFIDPSYGADNARTLYFVGDSNRDAIINLPGVISDELSGLAPVTEPHRRLNLVVRGTTDSAGDPFNEFHLNLANAANVSGSLTIRSGIVRLSGGFATGVPAANNTADLNLMLRNPSFDEEAAPVDFPRQLAVLSLTTPGASINVRNITIGDGTSGYSASSYGMIASEVEGGGQVTLGDGHGNLFLNPAADNVAGQTFTGAGSVVAGPDGNRLTLSSFQDGFSFGNLRAGMQLVGSNIPDNTYIVQLDPVSQTIVLSRAIAGADGATVLVSPTFNDAIANANGSQSYADARLYAMAGGELIVRAALYDDDGFGLQDAVGALTKVGRGDVRLVGAVDLATGRELTAELDGGINLHGGTLILDYTTNNGRKIKEVTGDPENPNTVLPETPVTFAGGNLWLVGNGTEEVSREDLRGVIVMRAGNSQIRVSNGSNNNGANNTLLTLGLPNTLFNGASMAPVRYAGSSLSFWADTSGGRNGQSFISMELPGNFQGERVLSWATFADPQTGKVNNFARLDPSTSGIPLEDELGNSAAGERTVVSAESNFLLNWDNNLATVATQLNAQNLRGYVSESDLGGAGTAGFVGIYNPATTPNLANPLRIIRYAQANALSAASNTFTIAAGQTLTLRSNDQFGTQDSGFLGGAILIANKVGSTNKFITGGSLSSELATSYFDPDVTRTLVAATDLLIHNYAEPQPLGGGVFTIGSDIVNNPASPATPLNLVHNGTGWTKLERAIPGGPGYSYTGSTFLNEGVLWITDPNGLGATPASADSDNLYFNGGTLRIADMTNALGTVVSVVPENQTLASNRGITIGGNGAFLNLVQVGTTLTYGGIISAEVHAPTFAGGLVRESNLGVGDFIKQGPGTLVLNNQAAHSYSGITDVTQGVLRIVSSAPLGTSSSANQLTGNLGSNFSYIDGTFVRAGAALEFESSHAGGGTAEWITLDGGTLRTTAGSVAVTLDGLLRVRQTSTLNLLGGRTRIGVNAGYVEGSGNLVKTGSGALDLLSNNNLYEGTWTIRAGAVTVTSQDGGLGTGTGPVTLGDAVNSVPAGPASLLLGSIMTPTVALTATTSDASPTVRVTSTLGLYPGMPVSGPGLPAGAYITAVNSGTEFTLNTGAGVSAVQNAAFTATADLNTPLTYGIDQSIAVVPEFDAFTSQVKRIGAQNHGVIANSGQNFDRFEYRGGIALGDDLLLSYADDIANTGIGVLGRDVILALGVRGVAGSGDLSGMGRLTTEILYNGDSVGANSNDLRVYYELNGNNSLWTGDLVTGNAAVDTDLNHIIRIGNSQALGANNAVTLRYNTSLQVAGHQLTLGSLSIASTVDLPGAGIFIENASEQAATVTIGQNNVNVPATWGAVFRDGVTPSLYVSPTSATPNESLSLVKVGAGTAILTQTNTYTGATRVGTAGGTTGGTLRLSNTGTISSASQLTVFAGAFEMNGGDLTLNQVVTLGGGAALTRAALRTGTGTLTLGNNVVYDATNGGAGAEITGQVNLGSTPRTFTVADSIGAAIDLDVAATLAGSSSLIKAGAGTLALGGANTFTGGVSVTAGTLLVMNGVNGSATGSGPVALATGSTLGGVGSIGGDVTMANGSFLMVGSPTISSGIELLDLNGSLSLGDAVMVDFYLGLTGFSRLAVDNLAAIGPGTQFRINLEADVLADLNALAGASFDILDWLSLPVPNFNLASLLVFVAPADTVGFITTDFNTAGVLRVGGGGQVPMQIIAGPFPQGETINGSYERVANVMTITATNHGLNPGEPVYLNFTSGLGTDGFIVVATAAVNTFTVSQPGVDTSGSVRVIPDTNFVGEFVQNRHLQATYARGGGTVTVTTVIPHGLQVGNDVYTTFTTGAATDGRFTVLDVPAANAFTIAQAGGSTLGDALIVPEPDGINDLPNNQILVLYPNHGLDAGDRVFLDFDGPAPADGLLTVLANTAGSFIVAVADSGVAAGDAAIVPERIANLGESVTFGVALTGTAPWSIQWTQDGVDIPGANGPTYTFIASDNSDGAYRARVGNSAGPAVLSLPAHVFVNKNAAITQQPVGGTINPGQSFTFTVLALNATTYQWYRNGVAIQPTDAGFAGEDSPVLVITGATQDNHAGDFYVEVNNGGTPVLSDVATLVVRQPVVITGITTDPPEALAPGVGAYRGVDVKMTINHTGTGPFTYRWFRNGIDIGCVDPDLLIVATPATFGNYRVEVSNGISPDPVKFPLGVGTVEFRERPGLVVITAQPQPQLVAAGSTLTLSCAAEGGLPMKFQWLRNGAVVQGATSPTLTIERASTSRAGRYRCRVTGTSTALTDEVEVGVVDTRATRLVQRVGTSRVVFNISAVGSVTRQWFMRTPAGDTAIPGGFGSTLTVYDLVVSDTAQFFCRLALNGTALSLNGGINELIVYDGKPEIDPTFTLPAGLVSAPYNEGLGFRIPLLEGATAGVEDTQLSPTRITASGLPPGMSLDSLGFLRGSPTTARFDRSGNVIPYPVTFTASNAFGSSLVVVDLLVQPLPAAVVGVFTGPVKDRVGTVTGGLNNGLGGQIDVTVASSGSFSGALTLGTAVHSLRGTLLASTLSPFNPRAVIDIPRRNLTPLRLEFSLDGSTSGYLSGFVTAGTETANLEGWRKTWVRTSANPNPACAFGGYYTLGLEIPQALSGTFLNPGVPQGTGIGTVRVDQATGAVSGSVALADGTGFTWSTFVGPQGQIQVFSLLYASNARGSVMAKDFKVQLGACNELNMLGGFLNWWRPRTPDGRARVYQTGFAPMDLDVVGGRYDRPAAGTPVMGIVPTTPDQRNALLAVAEANVDGNQALPPPASVSLHLATDNRVTVLDNPNSRGYTAAINASTGDVSGRFSLSQAHPFAALGAKPAIIARTVTYRAIIVRDGLGEMMAVGFFNLAQLPATPGQAFNQTPILSGQVLLNRVAPPGPVP